jgi:DUF971 family protein
MMPARVDPVHIAVSRSKGVTIEWSDGLKSEYSLRYLRDHCPCATCTGAHGTPPQKPAGSPFPMFQPALKILRLEPVGNYAIRIHWSDGHNTGLYTYEYLRSISRR